MSRSNFWQPSRNGSIPIARPGALYSLLRDNRIALSERRKRSYRRSISGAHLSRELLEHEEFKAIIGLWVLCRGTGHQQGDGTGDLMLPQPSPGKITPVQRILNQLDRLHSAGKSQFLAHSRIAA